MKKLLIASTALVATAGMASADITISGSAAAGIHSGLDAGASADGIYSQAGVDFAMSGATDNGISFSASVNIDAGTEVDTGDFELDGVDANAVSFGSAVMTGTFGTITLDDGGIDNLYNGDYTSADVSYSTTVGAISLSVAHDTADVAQANSMSAAYSASGMAFTLAASEDTNGTSASLSVAYALNDTVSVTGKTDQVADAESVQTITAATTLNGVSVSLSSANNSTWDVDLGYTAGGFALTYGVDETDAWTATATSALGGGATFAAGVSSDDEMYAGVSFAF